MAQRTFKITIDDPDMTQAYHYPEIHANSLEEALTLAYRQANSEDPQGVADLTSGAAADYGQHYGYEGEPRDAALPAQGEKRAGWW